jgi:hypothetical protein
MKRRTESETLTLLREIRDLVHLLVLRQASPVDTLDTLVEDSDRHSGSWSGIHGSSRTQR